MALLPLVVNLASYSQPKIPLNDVIVKYTIAYPISHSFFQRFYFRKKNWKFDPRGVEQCRDGASFSDAEKRALSEGCQIYGSLEVNRVTNLNKPGRKSWEEKC